MYSKKVMRFFKKPKNLGVMKNPDAIGQVGNLVCGDVMKVYLKIKDNVITKATFETFGCVSAIASSSMLTEMVKGKTLEDALKITKQDVVEALDGLPGIKIHCSVLATEALAKAIENYRKK
jgi:nitrogen fixation protein NifU and related proteins